MTVHAAGGRIPPHRNARRLLIVLSCLGLLLGVAGCDNAFETDYETLQPTGPATVSHSQPGTFSVVNQGLSPGNPNCPTRVTFDFGSVGQVLPQFDSEVDIDNPATHRLPDGTCVVTNTWVKYAPTYVAGHPPGDYRVYVIVGIETLGIQGGPLLQENDGTIYTTVVPSTAPQKVLRFSDVIQPQAAPSNSSPPGPEGVSVLPSGNVLVTDTPNNALESFTPAGVATAPFSTPFTSPSSAFNLPRQAAQVNSNEIDVGDSGNHRVERMLMSGGNVMSAQAFPNPGGTYPSWSMPQGLDVLPGGALVAFADAGQTPTPGPGHVNVFSNSPSWPTFETQINCSCFGNQGPDAVAFDQNGYLYVADTLGGTISKYSPTTGQQIQPPADGSAALAAAGAPNFIRPTGIAIDPISRNLFVADTAHSRVVEFNTALSRVIQIISTASGPSDPLSHPGTLAFDKNSSSPHYGDLYVADTYNDRVVHYALTTVSAAGDIAQRRNAIAAASHKSGAVTLRGKIHAAVPKNAPKPSARFGPQGSVRVKNLTLTGTLKLALHGSKKRLRRIPTAVGEILHSNFRANFSGLRAFDLPTHNPFLASGLLATRGSSGKHDVACFRVTPIGRGPLYTHIDRLTLIGGTGALAHLKLTIMMTGIPTHPLGSPTFLSAVTGHSGRARGIKSCGALLKKLH
jgi:hypothetical protein